MLACLQDRNDGVTGHRLLRQCYFQGRVMWALERPHLRAGGCVREALRQLRALRSKQNKKKKIRKLESFSAACREPRLEKQNTVSCGPRSWQNCGHHGLEAPC